MADARPLIYLAEHLQMRSIVPLYRILLGIIYPAVVIYTVAIAIRQGGGNYLKQRFGFNLPKLTNPIWIHCASVGELNAALPLIKEYLAAHDDTIVLTTATPSSAKVLRKQALKQVQHCYLPLDYAGVCQRFLQSVRPRCALIIETEIWLNLFAECQAENIPLYLLSARLSQKTLAYSKLLGEYYRLSLSAVKHIYARSQGDADCYARLSGNQTPITVTGNLKYTGLNAIDAEQKKYRDKRLCTRRYFLAASTHPGEEIIIAAALRTVSKEQLLIIVPRHPERGKSVYKQLEKQGFANVRLRSAIAGGAAAGDAATGDAATGDAATDSATVSVDQDIGEETSIYISNTIGELLHWIMHAELVFTGGSLANKGGHNLWEAAMLGIPQITGPHTENFAEEAQALLNASGLMQVRDAEALSAAFEDFAVSREAYQQMARNASNYIAERNEARILNRYLDILQKIT